VFFDLIGLGIILLVVLAFSTLLEASFHDPLGLFLIDLFLLFYLVIHLFFNSLSHLYL
jgi:hypothetical protein